MFTRWNLRLLLSVLTLSLVSLVLSSPGFADSPKDGDDMAIERCLKAWGDSQPFGWKPGAKTPGFKTMATNVKVLGVGGSDGDVTPTKDPELVLVKPSVAVLTENKLRLLNPNGWYCLKANVTVLSKTVIELACKASIADSHAGVAVLGSNKEGTGSGVTVLGKTVLKRLGCSKKS